ncbi:MAG TPA: transposase [Gammaproteobacteria bacterium]|nr:transposase [Gammaproteobacteria bacterium]
MARTARATVGGICYHVLNRGNDRKIIFPEPDAFDEFLTLVSIARAKHSVDIFAYCLMPNHFHFVVRPRHNDSLAAWVHWLLTTHAQAHRRRYGTAGHLWQGRYKASPIETDHHLVTVIRYVERNALRANLVERAEAWRWGSLRERLGFTSETILDEAPCALPTEWAREVNAIESESTLRAVRKSVDTERPFGSESWVRKTEAEFGARFTVRTRGRPKKTQNAGSAGPEEKQGSGRLFPKK